VEAGEELGRVAAGVRRAVTTVPQRVNGGPVWFGHIEGLVVVVVVLVLVVVEVTRYLAQPGTTKIRIDNMEVDTNMDQITVGT
jgi:hypothetical protein